MSPIDLEIYWNRLIAITDEAGATLKRTSFSTVVRESNDFACVLLDPEARLVAQSALSIPGFIGTAPLSLKGILKVFPQETLKPGDILFTNDPWIKITQHQGRIGHRGACAAQAITRGPRA